MTGSILDEAATSKINNPHSGDIRAELNEDIVRFDVTMEDSRRVHLDTRVHQLPHDVLRQRQ